DIAVAPTITQTVNVGKTSFSLVSSDPNPVFGEPLSITATISAVVPPVTSGSTNPSGVVSFTLDGATLPGGPFPLAPNGQVVVALPSLSVGTHKIRLSYSGDINFAGVASTSDFLVNVAKDNTTVDVTPSVPSTTLGNSVTFTATISADAPGSGN